MLPALLAPLLSTLAANGLGMLAGAIQAKGKEVIEKKLGITIPENSSALTPEVIVRLKEKEMEHEEFLISARLEEKKLSLEEVRILEDGTKNARNMNLGIQQAANAAFLAKVAAYYIDFIVICCTLILTSCIIFNEIPGSNKELAYMALGSLLTMCGTILNFHRGTSASSHHKDSTISSLVEGEKK